jgi:hypothetical protein
MTDYVVRLPLQGDDEVQRFGDYLNRFVNARGRKRRPSLRAQAPFVIVRSDLSLTGELKTVTFQERGVAADFSSGWAKACGREPFHGRSAVQG